MDNIQGTIGHYTREQLERLAGQQGVTVLEYTDEDEPEVAQARSGLRPMTAAQERQAIFLTWKRFREKPADKGINRFRVELMQEDELIRHFAVVHTKVFEKLTSGECNQDLVDYSIFAVDNRERQAAGEQTEQQSEENMANLMAYFHLRKNRDRRAVDPRIAFASRIAHTCSESCRDEPWNCARARFA